MRSRRAEPQPTDWPAGDEGDAARNTGWMPEDGPPPPTPETKAWPPRSIETK